MYIILVNVYYKTLIMTSTCYVVDPKLLTMKEQDSRKDDTNVSFGGNVQKKDMNSIMESMIEVFLPVLPLLLPLYNQIEMQATSLSVPKYCQASDSMKSMKLVIMTW